MFYIHILIFCCHLITYCYGTDTASFYGSSYIHVPLQDARSTTDIHFRFKTKRSDSFLLLVAGRTDYCIIRLEFGKLKIRINLGAGESEISTARGLKLDDLNWHEVSIARRDAEFVLIVDNIHITKEKLPGRFYELNIHYGLFLGGQGDFSELFLGHHDPLRGCLSDVEYNGVNILKKSRERIGAVEVHGVTWSCSPEFEAGFDREISFVENGAFMTLPNMIARTGTRWEFGIKTTSDNGLILYNTGLSSRSDYVGVEVVDSHLRLIVDRGSGAAELISEEPISDGDWHSVVINFTPTFLEITMDGKTSSVQLTPTGNRYLDLDVGEVLFIGGMELNKRARALGQGIKSADVSIKGCLRNLTFDGRRTGIPDAKVTMGLLPDCVWEYPCNQQPCINGATCHQQGVESFRCECDHPPCVKSDYAERYKIFSKTSLPIDLEIVKLAPLVTDEGKNSLITTDNIDVVLDYRKYGVRDSGLLFRILKPPEFGKILVENWDKHGTLRQVFTLLDISKDKIRYLHDGSENHHDKIIFDLELSPESGFLLPGYLQGRHRFVLHVNITPVNDPPTLELGPGKVLRLAQGTKKVISNDLLSAEDPDSSTSDLVYTVLNQGGKSEEKGFVERIGKPGLKVDTFTQKEIDNNAIVYVHRGKEGNSNSRLALQVSDGIETSPPVFLRISSFPLQIRLLNNTGVVLTYKSSVKITPYNLTFVTNAEDSTLEIRYDIVKLPQYGLIQRLINLENSDGPYSESSWQTVEHFTSQQIFREEIRYVHTSQTPSQDLFKFKVSVVQVKNPTEYDFRITFTKLMLEPVTLEEVYMNGTKDVTITEGELEYATKPLSTPKKNIVYKIVKGPKYGFLTLMTNKRRHLQGGDVFTQEDIERERLKYRLHRRGYSHIKDDFTFQTSAPDADSIPRVLNIIHIPTSKIKNEVHVTLEGLQVNEGGKQVLLPTHLDLRASVITSLVYNITHGPQFGRIEVMDKNLQNVVRRNATYFTSEELISERVYYIHDDSETRSDLFNFVALSSEEEDFQFVGEFHVNIILKNDNTPMRVIDKVFNVVTNGERLLTGRDLKYSDADIDSKPADIIYTRRGIPNGGLYLSEEPTKAVFEFSQEDLDEGLILFKHEGDEYGKIGLWITDGQYYANGVLEIRASPPYVVITNNTNLVVQQGSVTTLTTNHLNCDTNLNAWGDGIIYNIVDPPKHGDLVQLPEENPLRSFTQLQLEQGKISYSHGGDSSVKDNFRFRVVVQDTIAEGTFHIKIYPTSFWEELLVRNKTLYVEESTSVIISPSNLEVMHPNIAPSDITHYVVQQPAYGSLEIESSSATDEAKDDSKSIVKVFEQSVINDNQLRYVQEIANQTDDYFVVDATNGITWVRGLQLHIVVIPEFIYLVGGQFECHEGESVQLPNSLFQVQNEYYGDKITEYQVIQKPNHGVIHFSKLTENPVFKFTRQQFENGLIQYLHDGSETTEDEFTVIGKAGDKESMPAKVKIKIKEINDQKPYIVNNNGLELWEGSSAIITPSNLCVKDEDTPAQNITFYVTFVKTGHLALVSNPNKPIQEFTQAQIDSNQILFLHKGGQMGRFQFQFSDGETKSDKMIFNVSAKLVEIFLVNNKKLQIFPKLKKQISFEFLLAVTSDHTTSRGNSITYVVKKKPEIGRILLENGRENFKEVDKFTQADINETRVWYQHEKKFRNFHAVDSFVFDIHADFTHPLTDQIFNIDISVSSGGLDQFLEISPIEVKEGQSKAISIDTSKLISFLESQVGLESPTIQVHLNKKPEFGQLCYRTECNVTFFSQSQINLGEIIYQHDDSDSLTDQINFSIYLEPGDVLLCNVTLPVNIQPVNDQPFSIITLSPHLTVVQGQKYVLSKHELLTEDADTPPEEIVYDIINGPSQGTVSVFRNGSLNAESNGRFTQEDINSGKVAYFHSGSVQPTSFYFRVSDGKFNPTYTVFNIHVVPLALNITSHKPVYLQQCSSVALITADNIYIETNGEARNVKYNVTKNPKNGVIYLADTPSNYFTQMDLENKKVMYMQTVMSAPGDSFQVSGWIIETETPPRVEITITIKPLIVTGVFTPTIGSKNRLGVSVLDASPLAKITNSNPVYDVIKKPRLGRLKKIIRSSGERKNIKEKEVSKFSHEELKSGVIYYVTRKSINPDEIYGLDDSIVLQLVASIFQPAKVELKFRVFPEGNITTTTYGAIPMPPRLPGPKNPISHEGGITIASPNIKSDYILIVGMIVGVLLLAIVVVIIVRCRTIKKEERKSNKQDLQGPLPLPRPPDDLLPSGGRIKTFSSSNGSTPNSIPQCKVIPLGPVDSITSSDLEINARYPYGMSDEPVEDWSSYDTSETGFPHRTNNPMLRRNQYWV